MSANNHNQDGDWIIKVDQKKGTLANITNNYDDPFLIDWDNLAG